MPRGNSDVEQENLVLEKRLARKALELEKLHQKLELMRKYVSVQQTTEKCPQCGVKWNENHKDGCDYGEGEVEFFAWIMEGMQRDG